MGDQVQELRDFGLEGMGVFRHSGSLKGKSTSSLYEERLSDFKLFKEENGYPKGTKKHKKY